MRVNPSAELTSTPTSNCILKPLRSLVGCVEVALEPPMNLVHKKVTTSHHVLGRVALLLFPRDKNHGSDGGP